MLDNTYLYWAELKESGVQERLIESPSDGKTNEWLGRRYLCGDCAKYFPCKRKIPHLKMCYLYKPERAVEPDYKDAAEFEARVARKLSIERGYIDEDGACTIDTHCPNMLCEECRLKYARVQVEEEMDEKL